MSNVSAWNVSAASNNATTPDGWPEGQSPSSVNDCAREMMAALARWYQDSDGGLVSAGSSNAYTLTTNSSHATLGAVPMLVFRADRANTGAATLNVDGLGAKSIRASAAALVANDIVAGAMYAAVYNSNADTFELVGVRGVAAILAALLTVDGTGSGLDADTVDGSHASAFAAASHAHSAADVTSGTLAVARGGTGVTSQAAITRANTLTWTIQSDPGGTPSGTAGDVFAYY